MHGLRIIYSSCIVCVAMYGVHYFVQQGSLPTVPYNVKHSIHAWQRRQQLIVVLVAVQNFIKTVSRISLCIWSAPFKAD